MSICLQLMFLIGQNEVWGKRTTRRPRNGESSSKSITSASTEIFYTVSALTDSMSDHLDFDGMLMLS